MDIRYEKILQVISKVKNDKREVLMEGEAKRVLRDADIPIPFELIAHSEDESVSLAAKIGFPVVMKIISPDISHKSDVGGVRVSLNRKRDVRSAYRNIIKNVKKNAPKANILGISIQSQVSGLEVMVGAKRDPIFGPVVLFGLGGIFVELLEDINMKYCPITEEEALDMVNSIKTHPLLHGYRGMPARDIRSIVKIIKQISDLMVNVDSISEIDINPLIVLEEGKGATAADARIILSEEKVERHRAADDVDNGVLKYLMNPRSIALIGASRDSSKFGGKIMAHIVNHNYPGKLFPINPNGGEAFGKVIYKTIEEIDDEIDLALIALPSKSVPQAIRNVARKGTKVAIIFSAGFAEVGESGMAINGEMLAAARESKVRLVGPNTAGLMSPYYGNYSYFTTISEEEDVEKGSVGFVTQSGALGSGLISKAIEAGIHISAWVSTGNEADIDWTDIVGYLLEDPKTRVIVAYIEGIKNGKKLRKIALKSMKEKKPIIIFKAGTTKAAQVAAKSHTASIAVDENLFKAFGRDFGLVLAEQLSDTYDLAKAFLQDYQINGSGVGIVSGSGGANVILSDELSKRGINLPTLSEDTQEKLAEFLKFSAISNPVDTTGQVINDPSLLRKSIEYVLGDKKIDAVIVAVPGGTPSIAMAHSESIVQCTHIGKPILVAWLYAPAGCERAIDNLRLHGIPVFFEIEKTAKAMAALIHYKDFMRNVSNNGFNKREGV